MFQSSPVQVGRALNDLPDRYAGIYQFQSSPVQVGRALDPLQIRRGRLIQFQSSPVQVGRALDLAGTDIVEQLVVSILARPGRTGALQFPDRFHFHFLFQSSPVQVGRAL